MGIHRRATVEQQRAQAKRKRLIAGGSILATGVFGTAAAVALLTGGGESLPKDVVDAKIEFLGQIACAAQDEITITFGSPKKPGEGYTGDAVADTLGNHITLARDISGQTRHDTVIHEMVHACVIDEPVLFDRPFIPPSEPTTRIVGAVGFKVLYPPTGETEYDYNTFLEEGVAEYIASDVSNYNPSDNFGYQAVHTLTQNLAAIGGFSRDEIIELHQSSNLLGFVGGVYGIESPEVTADQLERAELLCYFCDCRRFSRAFSRRS